MILDLSRLEVVDGQSSPPSVKVSGRVVSNNSGAPLEKVAIYINSSLHEPRLAAMTNVDGEFKFRLGVDAQRHHDVAVTPEWDGNLLLLGGDSWREKQVPNPLLSGYVIRYRLRTLKKHIDAR